MLRRVVPAVLTGAALVLGALPAQAASAPAAGSVGFQLLGDLPVPGSLSFNGVPFGGLSGIDYDAANNTWRAISSDSSDHGPARFYFLNLGTSGAQLGTNVSSSASTAATAQGISAGQVTLLRADGTPYPPSATAGADTVQPEAIRFDPTTGDVFWANEGVHNSTLTENPAVRESTTDGHFVKQLPGATQEAGSATTGIRDGEGLTGLTFSSNGLLAVATLGGPLLQDGPNPTATSGAVTRIMGHSRILGGLPLVQFAYPLSALPLTDANGNGTNIVSDILAVDTTHYLVLETATAPGKGNSVRLYEIDTTGATNVTTVKSLSGATFTPVSKTLLLDFATLHLSGGVANYSGLTFGPTLSNGDRSLVLVSDNGFSASVATHILALDVHGI
ncbi:MAG TPA: esterase-like activity of phytase family protein [Pseudonocardiaceae bacterium]